MSFWVSVGGRGEAGGDVCVFVFKNLWKCWCWFFSFRVVSILFFWTINFSSSFFLEFSEVFFFILYRGRCSLAALRVRFFFERFLIWFIVTFWLNGFFSRFFVKFPRIFKNKISLEIIKLFRQKFLYILD